VTSHILTAIDGIAAEARKLLESDEDITEQLGTLISINQGLLNSVGVGHEKLDTVARITKEIGWTKLTGAGGGGCALTLLREGSPLENDANGDVSLEQVKEVEGRLRDVGFKPFEVELGGKGVGVLAEVDDSMIQQFEQSVSAIAKEDKDWMYWN